MQSASPLPPREEYTDINIRENGEWYTGNRKIINTNVLDYFQSNLHRDEKGIYIFNRFGEFSEKGYVKIKGPVMPVIDLDQDRFLLKGDKKIRDKKKYRGEKSKKLKGDKLKSFGDTIIIDVPFSKIILFFSIKSSISCLIICFIISSQFHE